MKGIVHVGARYAEEMDDYLALAPRFIIWIEADPDTCREAAKRLRNRVVHGNQLYLQALIGDEDGVEYTLYRWNNRASSSIFPSTGLTERTWPGVAETGETVELVSCRLDTLLAATVHPREVGLLVLDIQGAELMALRGAGAYLDAVETVEVELSMESFYEGAPLAPEIDDFLVAAGFERLTEIPRHGNVVYRRVQIGGGPPST